MKYAPEKEFETLEEIDLELDQIKIHCLMVYNDDVNSFDHVIDTLVNIVGHDLEQAEQCTLIIHYKGKCSVRNGDFDELAPMRKAIVERGISAEIELR